MKVIFIKDSQYWKKWEIKEVSFALANNVLIPQKIALNVDSTEWKNFINKLNSEKEKKEKIEKKIENEIEKLIKTWLKLKKKINQKWYLFEKINDNSLKKIININEIKIKLPHEIQLPWIYHAKIIYKDKEYDLVIDIEWIQ